MLVVNEPPLAEAINRLRGEWAEQSGGELAATSTAWADLDTAKSLDADLIIFPSRYLGDLGSRGWLRPVRSSVLESDDLKATDYFTLVRADLMKWRGETVALPLGIDPLAIGTPSASRAMQLFVRAAPHAVSNDRLGVLFDTETMKPRLNEPAYVDALTQMQVAEEDKAKSAEAASARDDAPTPVLGYNDRLVAVTSTSHNAASAFKLLVWLAKSDVSTQFARVGDARLPPRRSLATAANWYPASLSAGERAEQGRALDRNLSAQKAFVVPRIPGIDEYLAAVDAAVQAAVDKKVPPAEALRQAADTWEQITERRDRKKQHDAFLKHLGIDG